jgi:hypothetical protein
VVLYKRGATAVACAKYERRGGGKRPVMEDRGDCYWEGSSGDYPGKESIRVGASVVW